MIDGLKTYGEYRPSAQPWLGNMPAHWNEQRAKFFYREVDERSATGEEELMSVSHVTGVTPRKANVTMFKSESTVGYKICRPGDIVINTMWAFMGALGVARQVGLVSPSYGVYRPRGSTQCMHPDYIDRLVKIEAYKSEYLCRSTGIHSSRLRLYPDQFLRIPLLCPPPEEQAAIVRFLDYIDRRVKRYIRAKRKLIALLNEQKQAIIHRAVTRGLDPNVPLKPSGVPWLGDVPEHWEVLPIRKIVRPGCRITYGIVQPGIPDPSGRYMIRGKDYSSGWADKKTFFRVSDEIENPYRRSRLVAGDIVITIVGAGLGNAAVVPDHLAGSNITQTSARISVDQSKFSPRFLHLVLEGPVGKRNVERYVYGAAQPRLNLPHVGAFIMPVPPVVEQESIVDWTQKERRQIDVSIDLFRNELELLHEYRLRIIADLVTGKLDVGDAATRLPDEFEPASIDEVDESIGDELEVRDIDAELVATEELD